MAVERIELPDLENSKNGAVESLLNNLDVIKNIKVKLSVCLGEGELTVEELFELKQDSIIKLDRPTNAPVDLILDGRLVARGELVAVDDNFGIRIIEIKPNQ